MPPLPQLRSPAIKDLYEQLRFAPPRALKRDIERAETLAGEVDHDTTYPEDWIVFRVTGFRPEIEQPRMTEGAGLLADLSSLVERLSHDARLSQDELDGDGFLDAATLCRRWGVSRKTIDRYRRQGLVARRVRTEQGRSVLMFASGVVETFERTHGRPISRAGDFTRIAPDELERIVRRAARYRAALGLSLNEAALRLARRFNRSHEGIRQLLIRHDASALVFGRRPPPMDRRKALALRASRLGIEPADLARRFGRSRASVSRTIVEARADVLRSFRLADPGPNSGPVPWPPDELFLGREMGSPGRTDLAALIAGARATPPPDAAIESSRAMARRRLEGAAGAIVAAWPKFNVSRLAVDEAETLLRLEARLRAEMLRAQLGNIVRTVEDRLGTPVDHLPPGELTELMTLAIGAAGAAAGSFDPEHGGRMAAPVGLAVSKAVAAWDRVERRPKPPGRATPLLRPGHVVPDWTRRVSPWQADLEPDERVRRFAHVLPTPERSVLEHRFGLGGRTPCTAARTAEQLGLAVTRIAPLMRRGIRLAIAASRGG
ncbi:MAG: hypothetical protein IID31_07250 [Planctomycetes bacterium]|nr:hypothetical protein [Planctomycetota bacterium]